MLSSTIRADFPILNKDVNDLKPTYFDNACMSLRPQKVMDSIERYYTDMSACAGRSNHRFARQVTEAVDKARITVKNFIGAKYSQEIIFTRNTTEGINLVANTLGLKAGEVVITSDKEHNSNLVPWLKLKRTMGITHVVVPSHPDNTFNLSAFEKLIDEFKPKLVSVVHTSNVDGVTNPVEDIVKLAHRNGAMVLVDAAQSVPHRPINVQKLGVDFLVFSGHKMMGPSGMGVLYGKRELLDKMDGFLVGGDTVEYTTYIDYKHLPLPEKFEAGLQDYAGIMGLGTAVEFLSNLGLDNIHQHEIELNTIISEGLADEERVHLIGPHDPKLRGGVFSFTVDGVDVHQIALMLDNAYGIMVRSGQHCVHSWFHDRGIKGSVRASLYAYNTAEEAEYFVESLKKILAIV